MECAQLFCVKIRDSLKSPLVWFVYVLHMLFENKLVTFTSVSFFYVLSTSSLDIARFLQITLTSVPAHLLNRSILYNWKKNRNLMSWTITVIATITIRQLFKLRFQKEMWRSKVRILSIRRTDASSYYWLKFKTNWKTKIFFYQYILTVIRGTEKWEDNGMNERLSCSVFLVLYF